MATISKRASLVEDNILDIVSELKRIPIKIESKEQIESRKKSIEIYKKLNKKVSSRISYIKKKIDELSDSNFNPKLLDYYEELNDFKKNGVATHTNRTGNNITLRRYDIRFMKNFLNRAIGKDFYYRINDGFNKKYNIKRSVLIKMEDSSFIINKFREGVEKEIIRLKSIKNKDSYTKNKIFILEDRLLNVIKFNQKMIKYGNVEESKLPKSLRQDVDLAFSKNSEEKKEKGRYPILIFISEERIEF